MNGLEAVFDKEAFYRECVDLTRELVAIPSINSTDGEGRIAGRIEEILRSYPYFRLHPEQIFTQELGDEWDRKNVFALVKGRADCRDTIILHGHTDTVDIDNYGDLRTYAYECDRLMEEMKKRSYDREVEEDLQSGHYMVGRGVCDMKAGISFCMNMLRFCSEHTELLKVNLLFMANPGEEMHHNGILAATEVLERMCKGQKMRFRMAVNMDCSNPHYAGDDSRYFYYGTVGKILPCFYIVGKETHIGQCYLGVDAAQMASRLINGIHLNLKYADEYQGEVSMPPSVLRYQDSKTHYSVNTAKWAFIYFNFLVLQKSPEDILGQLKQDTIQIMDGMMKEMNECYSRFCQKNKRSYEPLPFQIRVLLYEELYQEAEQKINGSLEDRITEWIGQSGQENEDPRETAKRIVQKLLEVSGYEENVIVIFLAPPFMQHNTLRREDEAEHGLAQLLNGLLERFEKEKGIAVRHVGFYPSLSDSSYLKMDDGEASAAFVERNMAGFSQLGQLHLAAIKGLNIPALNMGCYGKDPHRNTERLDTDYSFRTLPEVFLGLLETV